MFNALKRLDKKFLVLVGFIIGLPLIVILLLVILRGCNSKITYQEYEEKMIAAAEKYIQSADKAPTQEGEKVVVELSKLVEKEYIKSTEDLLEDTTCTGNVSVRRNGASVESTNGGYLNYIVDLKCDNYATTHLIDKIKENVVTEESGLYEDGENYIFRGNKVNNYIRLYGVDYRIVSIDKDGFLKLIKNEPEATYRKWDNKYNIETNRQSGKNIYKDSSMLSYLLYDYESPKKINANTKKMIVAHDACIGKRNENNIEADLAVDCSEILESQVVSLLNVSDYIKASTDPDCLNLRSRSCNNYNYLYSVASSTWTLNASLDNSYNVLSLSDGLMESQMANVSYVYNIVIYIDGQQLYTSGNGQSTNPYIYE